MFEQIYSIILTTVKIIGILGTIRLIADIVSSLKHQWSSPPKDFTHLKEKYGSGSFAVITDASSTLGAQFSTFLANLGFNLVLLAPSNEALEYSQKRVEESIDEENRSKIKIKGIVADFKGSAEVEFFKKVETEIGNLDISILVNNTEMQQSPSNSEAIKPDYQELIDLVTVNCCSQVGMTKLIAPRMIKRGLRTGKRGAVIDLSSFVSITPFPQVETYNATKIFNNFITLGLGGYKDDWIDWLSLQPTIVKERKGGEGSGRGAKGLKFVKADDVVRGAFADLGVYAQSTGARSLLSTWYGTRRFDHLLPETWFMGLFLKPSKVKRF